MESLVKIIIIVCLFFVSTSLLAAPSHIGNVKGYTLNNAGELIRFSNMVFDAGKVVAIGTAELRQKYPNVTFIDGQGKVL
jgi:imidazolonepropionase-like amidohydrolase